MSTVFSKQWKAAALSICLLLLMAYLDHISGYELVFSAAYLLPVAVCAWNFSRKTVIGMSIAGGVATWIVDYIGGTPYSHFIYHYGNSVTCFLVSLTAGLLLHQLRHTLIEREKTNDKLREALARLEESTQEIRKLQDGLQVVCAWTKQIKVEDTWMTPDEFLAKRLRLTLSHGISPEGVKQFNESADQN